ncbi:MAG: murein biosynthesis integral membrane protein MurJ [Candidatus Dadabacteria bacterium]|nr:MAG: murein biosynthesis integral membrane protein MurJ [Candidatus Dadabacteria bacterium]
MKTESNSKTLLRGTGIVSSLNALSRIFGFIRDLIVARIFGAGYYADAFFVAFKIPNVLRSFVAEGALTSAFVPIFSEKLKRDQNSAKEAFKIVTGFMLQVTLFLSALGIIYAEEIVRLFGTGFVADPGKFSLCVELTRIMFPYIVFVSQVAMINGALNTLKIYGAAPLAQIVMNITLIAGAIVAGFYNKETAIHILAYSVLLGGFVQVLIQFRPLARSGLLVVPAMQSLTGVTVELLKLMLPALLGAGIYQLQIIINTMLASLLQQGSVAWLYYADRLAQLPIGVFAISLSSVLLPSLSLSAADSNEKEFSKSLNDALRYTSFVMLPLAAGMFFAAEPLVRLLFERGAFSATDTAKTALAVQALAIGLWGISCNSVIIRAFLARKDTLTPALTGLLTLLLSLALSLIFMGSFSSVPQNFPATTLSSIREILMAVFPEYDLKHAGIALAISLATTCSMLVLVFLTGLRVKNLDFSPFASATRKSLISVMLMYGVLKLLPLEGNLVLITITGALIYLLFQWFQQSSELKETFLLISRKLG